MPRIKNIILALLALLYGTSLFSLAIPFAARDGLFVSPDEHATWTFAQSIAESGVAQIEEMRNVSLDGFLHPRSTVTVGSSIVPAGFLGLTYLAGAFFFISPLLAAFVGPLFCLLGLFALYKIVRFLGASAEFAVWTVIALAIHPAWWYYSIRSLMPNVPFVALLLAACWMGTIALQKKVVIQRCAAWFFSGILFATALSIRPSEWIWIGGCLLAGIVYVVQRHKGFVLEVWKERKKEVVCLLLGVSVVGVLMLALQSQVYGSPFTTGYTVDQSVWEVGGSITADAATPWYEKLFATLFPFGIHERATFWNVWRYVVALYPWMTVVGMIGVGVKIRQMITDRKRIKTDAKSTSVIPYLLILISLVYLLVLYGSWVFFDNPDPSVVSLGNSHTRYWLPVFVLLAPATAYVLQRGRDLFLGWAQSDRTKQLAHVFPITILVLMTAFSANLVFSGDDGVAHTREALATFAEKRTAILQTTPSDAIVIVDRADKYLWPHRAVVVPFRSEETYAKIPELLDSAPLYYFSITLPQEDLAYLNEVTFAQTNITFTPIITINEETLYEITRQ